MKRNLLTFVIGAVLVVIFVLLLFVFQVRQSEVAVVTTFDRPTAHPYDQPGAYFKWPWPIQKVYKFDQRVQNLNDAFSETYTHDNITLLTSVYVGWKISDASVFFLKFPGDISVSLPTAQSRLEGMLRSAKNNVIGKHDLSDLVNADPRQLKFDEIENAIEQDLQGQLKNNNYGIELEFLGFKKIGLPESVTAAVFDRMKSERQEFINKYQSTGDSEAMKIRSESDRQASELIADAEASAQQIRGEGEAEAAKTYKVLQQNPDLADFLLQVHTLPQLLNQKTTLIFDERTAPFNLFTSLPTNSPALQP